MYCLQTSETPRLRAARPSAVGTGASLGGGRMSSRFDGEATRRAVLGQTGVSLGAFGREHCAELTPDASVVHLVVPLTGAAVAVSNGDSRPLAPGRALLLTKRQRTEFVWMAGSSGLVLDLPIALLQQSVAASFPGPRRLAATTRAFDLDTAADGLAGLLTNVLERGAASVLPGTEQRIARALIDALRAADEDAFFPVSRSLQRAFDFLMAHPDSRCSPEELAGIAGVTLSTLQRNAKHCLCIPLSKFVEHVRLTWVRAQLGSPRESRSMAQLAEACGYKTVGTLARSYQRLFGETPTQTRGRAFAVARL